MGADQNPAARFKTRLPGLEVALNAERMTAYLRPLLAPLSRAGSAPTVIRAQLLDHKPGGRGVIRFEVTGTQRGERCVVFGKLFTELSRATQVYKTLCLLQADVFPAGTRCGVPLPLGCLPDPPLLVYLPAEGQLLDQVIAGDQAFHLMRLIGTWLATLHRHRLRLEKHFHLATEFANLRAWAAVIGGRYPEEAETASCIVQRLQEWASELQFETDIPIHKDFHYGHIVVDNGIKVVDFDEMRLGDPNFDLAHFCANLRLLAHRRKMAARFSILQSEFLGAYARETGWVRDGRFAYFFAYTCLKIGWQLCIRRGPRPRPVGETRRRQVRWVLAEGLAALSLRTGAGGAG